MVPKSVLRSTPAMVRKAREKSLAVIFFNLLPEEIQIMNTDHVDKLKNHLDNFLCSIPDQPTASNLSQYDLLLESEMVDR